MSRLYPSFMMHNVNAAQLNLTVNQIETYVSTLDPFRQSVFNHYYKHQLSGRDIGEMFDITAEKVHYHLNKIKDGLKVLSQFLNADITLIVGRSGVGKSTLESRLCELYNLEPVRSYTTRKQRSEDDDTHIFIDEKDLNQYPDKVATTVINNHHYFATKTQLLMSNIYVIDPNGLYELTKNLPDFTFNLIHLKPSKAEHNIRLKKRRMETHDTRQSQKARFESENEQFTQFEQKVKQGELPNNVTIIPVNKLIPNF